MLGGEVARGVHAKLLAVQAGVAHLAERDLPKVEVAGSSPVSRSPSVSLRSTSVERATGVALIESRARDRPRAWRSPSVSLRSTSVERATGVALIESRARD